MSDPDKLTIETPEQTVLEFPLAGIGSRFLALATDTIIQMAALGLLSAAAGLTGRVGYLLGVGSLSMWAIAGLVLLGLVVYEGYFAAFEAVWNGQTPGKRLIRLRVMKDDGRPIGVYDAIARNLLRIVDQLPGIYAVGVVVMLLSRQSKRVGDHVAGTVVVHEKTLVGARPFGDASPEAGTTFLDASRISLEEFRLIETFLQRRAGLPDEVRRDMARQISSRIAAKLGVEPAPWPACEQFLETIFAQARSRGLR